jgi:hypothetical protein
MGVGGHPGGFPDGPPVHVRDMAAWRVVAKDLKAATLGADPAEVSIALRMALSLEGVECRPQ